MAELEYMNNRLFHVRAEFILPFIEVIDEKTGMKVGKLEQEKTVRDAVMNYDQVIEAWPGLKDIFEDLNFNYLEIRTEDLNLMIRVEWF